MFAMPVGRAEDRPSVAGVRAGERSGELVQPMTRTRSEIWIGVAWAAVALAVVSITASVGLWWFAISVGVIDSAFSEWVFNDHLTLVVGLIAGSAAVGFGLALTTLYAGESSARSLAPARFALTCIAVAVVISLCFYGISRGVGA